MAIRSGVPYTGIQDLYIGGRWIRPEDGAVEPVLNPATEAVIGSAPVGGRGEAEAAIAAAREAFDRGPWPCLSFKERAEVMCRMHGVLTGRLNEIRALTIAEAGAPWGLTQLTQTATPLRHLDYGIELANRIEANTTPVETFPNLFQPGGPDSIGAIATIKEPVGVVAGITGYNFPFLLNLSKIVPALLAGNTLVLKPSPFTPYAALLFGEVADEVGLPPGVLNVLTGGLEVGQLLTSHPDVDLISFTGSDTVGAAIMAQAAPTLKRLVMELGGKSALIVREDADIQKAALTAVAAFTAHAGQGCALTTRFLVHNKVRPAFVQACAAIAAHWTVGDPSQPTTIVGPLIRESQRAKVERYVQLGHDSGGRLVFGGKRPGHCSKGFFYEPTLFDGVDNGAAIAQDEIFGPVGVVIGFDDDDEAVTLANQSKFGLAGGVMTADRAQGYRMALRMRTGTVWLNGGFGGDMSSHAPFGGYKRSGFGREYGPGWLDEYLQQKAISFPIG
ncbi:MAG: aldehyde dehydrogenase family protein [Azospirillaceae bacterium]|nr:aldehyde dehydrogenase family protein [Azospirillaceae bacterium]